MIVKYSLINQAIISLLLIVFPVHAGVTYLFQSTLLVAWKQIIVLFIAFLGIIQFKKINSSLAILLFIYCFIFVINYPYVLFGHVELRFFLIEIISLAGIFAIFLFGGKINEALLRRISMAMIFIIGVGFLVDYYTGYFYFLSNVGQEFDGAYRPVFLLGSSTLLFPILGGFFYIVSVTSTSSLYSSVAGLWVIFIAYISGSRASFILLIFIVLVFFVYAKRIKLINKNFLLITVILLSVLGLFYIFLVDLNFESRFINMFSREDAGNISRYRYWEIYFSEILPNLQWFGSGLGYLKSSSNIYTTSHFESSFIYLSIEIGIMGIILVYGLMSFLLLHLSKDIMAKSFILLYFTHSILAPSLISIIGLSFVGVVVGMSRIVHNKNCI